MAERIYATGMAYRLRSQWDRDEGLGQNHNAVKFLGQDFERLKAQSVQSGRLFEDTYFPATASSLGFNELGPRSSKTSGVRWLRPPVSLTFEDLNHQSTAKSPEQMLLVDRG